MILTIWLPWILKKTWCFSSYFVICSAFYSGFAMSHVAFGNWQKMITLAFFSQLSLVTPKFLPTHLTLQPIRKVSPCKAAVSVLKSAQAIAQGRRLLTRGEHPAAGRPYDDESYDGWRCLSFPARFFEKKGKPSLGSNFYLRVAKQIA